MQQNNDEGFNKNNEMDQSFLTIQNIYVNPENTLLLLPCAIHASRT